MNGLLTPLDLYCERLNDGFFAEPFNFLSNAAFIFSAILMARSLSRTRDEKRRRRLKSLTLVAFCVGLGSGLFHSLPNRLTQAADVLPIALFVALAIYYYFRSKIASQTPIKAPLGLCLAFLIVVPIAIQLTGLARYLNKGEFYCGIMPALLTLAIFEGNRKKKFRLFAAAILFSAAFTARTLDPILCGTLPIGTHFLWHLLTAAVAYLVASLEREEGL